MKAMLVRVGNSRDIRLPKALIDVAGLDGEVDIHAEPGLITIRPIKSPRAGWAEAVAEYPPEGLLYEPTPTRFDEDEWAW